MLLTRFVLLSQSRFPSHFHSHLLSWLHYVYFTTLNYIVLIVSLVFSNTKNGS